MKFAFVFTILLTSILPVRAELTLLRKADLDGAAFTQWVDGAESPAEGKEGPAGVVWTQDGKVDWPGVSFGESKSSGVRHLRVGFTKEVAAGSLLVRGGGRPDVLESTAAYPGKVDDDAQWTAAVRMGGTTETGREDFALWVLPPGTVTRAIRFTHTTAAADARYAGWLGGVAVMAERAVNLAPQAMVSVSANPKDAEAEQ